MSDGPINYNAAITPANPMAAFQQGFGLSQGIQQTFDARAAAEAQARQQAETEALRQKVVSGMATGAERADFLTRLAPEQTKAYQGALEGMDKEVLKTKATQLGKINAAFASGNKEVAIGLMQDQADALRGAGDDEGAKLLDNAIKIEQTQPGQGQFYVGTLLALMGKEGQDILDSSNKNLAAPGDRALTRAQEALAWAQATKAGLGGDLSPEADKIINSATDNVSGSLLLATQADNLAKSYDEQRPPAGWVGSALDWARKAVGGQGVFDSLKQEYVRLRNTDVLKNLPPGVASDKDIEIALLAFPDDNANPGQISAFLRGTAKLHRYSAEVNKARAEWVIQNGNLGPARAPLTVGGDEVGKGTSFWDFTKAIPIPNVAPGASTATTTPATGTFGASGTPTTGAKPATSGEKTVKGKF